MTTWHDRLDMALTAREKGWPDLVAATKAEKPSVYAWRPTAKKRSTMMNGDNAALVCELLEISPVWLFHGRGQSGLEKSPDVRSTGKPMSRYVQELCDLAGKISELGLKHLLLDAEEYVKKYPATKAKKGKAA